MESEEIWNLVDDEKSRLVELLEGLSESDWNQASLCDGWRVRDVVAHQILPARFTIIGLLVALVRARGNIEALIRDTAIRLGNSPTQQLLEEFRGVVGSRATPPRTVPMDRLMDTLVHAQDIAVPLGLSFEPSPESTRLALERVWTMGPPFDAQRKLAGHRLVATDLDWSGGDGTEIRGPGTALLMLATGRTAKADELSGEGLPKS